MLREQDILGSRLVLKSKMHLALRLLQLIIDSLLCWYVGGLESTGQPSVYRPEAFFQNSINHVNLIGSIVIPFSFFYFIDYPFTANRNIPYMSMLKWFKARVHLGYMKLCAPFCTLHHAHKMLINCVWKQAWLKWHALTIHNSAGLTHRVYSI